MLGERNDGQLLGAVDDRRSRAPRFMSRLEGASIWRGWDVAQGSPPPSPAEFNDGTEVGGERAHYELLALAGRGFRPPQFLTIDGALDRDVDDVERPTGRRGPRLSWSVEYRWIAETAPDVAIPYAIYLLGVNPPPDVTDAELETFNDFYTNVHLREVAERRHALRAERFERERVFLPPAKGAPRFLAVYEVDEAGASQRRHVGPPYSSGPDVWQRHTTPWRLWYRRVPP
ncbi:MAG TPA: hypothetical protein VGZ03_01550 [Acidimicrobiales bacterium]|nr:hypothetical protein [Acidimicrobiales bacterium]